MFLSSTSLMERTKTPTWTERGEGEEELDPGEILFIISTFILRWITFVRNLGNEPSHLYRSSVSRDCRIASGVLEVGPELASP